MALILKPINVNELEEEMFELFFYIEIIKIFI